MIGKCCIKNNKSYKRVTKCGGNKAADAPDFGVHRRDGFGKEITECGKAKLASGRQEPDS